MNYFAIEARKEKLRDRVQLKSERKTPTWKGFWLAKHKQTNIPTMKELFPPPAAWF
jgi:hypothetical protein